MEKELLLKEALAFFHLTEEHGLNDIHTRYHELAKKYHPDKGEFSSDVMFKELLKYRDVLIENEKTKVKKNNKKDPIFAIYRHAKQKESEALIRYFDEVKNLQVILDEKHNQYLRRLKADLTEPIQVYNEICKNHPDSIWFQDCLQSIERLKVWYK